MAHGPEFSDFTPGEKARIAGLVARMAVPGSNHTRLRRKIERIERDAMRRKSKK
ncbi:DUF6257 family protein [Streptomyces sp. NPDC086669]|uniref:DUF6257 family protein n=1 Tax=Streptomyces sp. NPDC086669 TaxID=3365753 RepID=UPI00382BF1E5